MNRFDQLWAKMSAKSGVFIPFVVLGDPDLERSYQIIDCLVKAGVDGLELGLPFSDPLLDGAVIQSANTRALQNNHRTIDSFALITKIRQKFSDIPISLLLCANLIEAMGIDNFYQQCQKSGVDAVLVADIPIFASKIYRDIAKKYQIAPVFICPPNADDQTIADIAKYSQSYIYLTSRAGVTGADNQRTDNNLPNLIKKLKKHTQTPILQGFGIAYPSQIIDSLNLGTKGVICGSAIINIIEKQQNNINQCLSDLTEFVLEMKKSC